MSVLPGDRAVCDGRYRLERVLGRGPSGVLYQVTDLSTSAERVLKRLHAHFHEEEVLSALRREAQLAAELAHPAILAPLATGADEDADGSFYLVSELFAGESLRARLLRGPLSPAEALRCFGPLCAALDAAHGVGLYHGDLVPGNVLLGEGPSPVRLTDFGMHRLGLSRTAWSGALGYLPPESYRGEVTGASARGDIFALGALLYECLTGQRLFDAPSPSAVMFKVCLSPLTPITAPLPLPVDVARVEALLAMACAKDPAARFETPGALWRAMQAVLGEPGQAALARGPAPVAAAPEPGPGPRSGIDTRPMAPPQPEKRSTLENWLQEEPEADEPAPAAPSPETTEPPLSGPLPRPRVLGLWAGVGGLAMASLLLFLIGMRGHHRHKVPDRPPESALSPAPSVPVPPGLPGPAAPAAPGQKQEAPGAGAPRAEDTALLLAAEERLSAHDYAGALGRAEELLRRVPADPAAREVHRRAGEALRLSAVYEGFMRAAERGDADTAMALYRELPAGSAFRVQAQEPFGRVREQFERSHLEFASAALRSGVCDEVQRQAEQIVLSADDPGHGAAAEVRRMLNRCRGRERERDLGGRAPSAERAHPSSSPGGLKAGSDLELKNPFKP